MKSGSRAVIWAAIVLGGTAGVLAAIAGSPEAPEPRSSAAPSLEPAANVSNSSRTGFAPAIPAQAVSLAPAAPAVSLPSAGSGAASAALPAVPSIAGGIPVAALPPLPVSADELTQAEILCYKKDSDQCQRVALAHETGSAGAKNAAQAKRFRKIALTFYVAECERGLPHACFVLSHMYENGTVVKHSERTAKVLFERAVDLCRIRPAEECRLLER